jgi:hypothetical protein
MKEIKEQKKILEDKQMNEIDEIDVSYFNFIFLLNYFYLIIFIFQKNIKKIENFITLLKQLHSFVEEGDIKKVKN